MLLPQQLAALSDKPVPEHWQTPVYLHNVREVPFVALSIEPVPQWVIGSGSSHAEAERKYFLAGSLFLCRCY